MTKKSAIVVGIAAAVVAVSMAYGAIANPGAEEESLNSGIWNIRISGPEFENVPTIGSEIGILGKGTYEIGFVPMGDSPEALNLEHHNIPYLKAGKICHQCNPMYSIWKFQYPPKSF